MTRGELLTLIRQNTDRQLLAPTLLDEDPPYVFESSTDVWNEFRDCFVGTLGVSRSDIRIVGSGRLGFSLKPGFNLRMFRDTSDIDLLIVSSTLFDELWISLLSAAYPRKSVAENLGGWLERKRNEVYTGYLNPSDIKLDAKIYGAPARPVLALRTKWFTALNEASQFPIRGFEAIKGRLYRTWQHAKLYHLNSLASPNAGSRGSISDSGGRTRRQGGWGDVRLRAVRSAISIVNRYQLSSLPGLDPAIHRLRKSILQRTNTWHSVRSL